MTSSNSKQQDNTDLRASRNFVTSLVFFFAGGGIGAAMALLFAPKSGVELRTDISDRTKKGYDETLELAHQLQEQSVEVYHSLKEKADKVLDLAAVKWSRAGDAAEGTLELAGQVINGEMMQANDKSAQEKVVGRRPSHII